MEKRKRKELSLKEKVQLINQSNGRSQRQLAEIFGIGKTQVQNILKRKAEIMEGYQDGAGSDRKRMCVRSPNEELNNVMWDWFKKARASGLPVSGPILQEKALMFAHEFGVSEDFKASTGWLIRFRQRHNISFLSVCGESAGVSQETVDEWKARIPDIVKGYSARDIFNMDETGLFFRALPDKSLNISGEECKGGKKSKDRLTVSLCVNMEGEFEKIVVIGKSAKPRCFRNLKVKNLPVTWYHNKKAWMTQLLFKNWIEDFNAKMVREGRHVVLILDNAPAHPDNLALSNVKLVFLPKNTTSKLQPLDQGIIQNVKQIYKKRLLRTVISKIDSGSEINAETIWKQISVLDAVQWIHSAMKEVKPETVSKCFGKAGFTSDCVMSKEEEDEDDNVPILELVEMMRKARGKISVKEHMTPEEYMNIDSDIPSHEDLNENWEEELLETHKETVEETEDDPDDQEEQDNMDLTCDINSHQEALRYIEQLKLYCMRKDLCSVLPLFVNAEEDMERLTVNAMCGNKQTTLTDFFQKSD